MDVEASMVHFVLVSEVLDGDRVASETFLSEDYKIELVWHLDTGHLSDLPGPSSGLMVEAERRDLAVVVLPCLDKSGFASAVGLLI